MPKIKIFILQDFLHQTEFGMERFFKDEIRLVSPIDAHYFCGQAWAALEPDDSVNNEISNETVLFVDNVKTNMVKTHL